MFQLDDVMEMLRSKGTAQTRKVLLRHGAPESMFGVQVADLKQIAKQLKGQQELAYQLYDSGNPDAMYLAAIVADGSKMSKKQLDQWAKNASWSMISEYAVPWMAVENEAGREMALKWIKSKKESIASSGWATYSGLVAVLPDEQLDLDEIQHLLSLVVEKQISAPNRVRYTMNGFVIAVGAYVKPLLKAAKKAALAIGKVEIDVGETSCKVPDAVEMIRKIESMGRVGKKRKTIKC